MESYVQILLGFIHEHFWEMIFAIIGAILFGIFYEKSNNAIVGTIIKVIKWIAPNGVIQLSYYFKIERHIRKFFENFEKKGAVLIVPPADVDTIIKGTQICDFLGLMELQEVFHELGYEMKTVRADDISEEEKRHNLISVSGPIPNAVTKFLLEQNEVKYKFGGPDGHSIINLKDSNVKFNPLKNEKGLITTDFGIITRMKNPYEPNREAIIVCGSYGWGTQAALRLLTDKDSLVYLNNFGQYFQVICTCGVDEDRIGLKPYLVDLHPNESMRQKTIANLYTVS